MLFNSKKPGLFLALAIGSITLFSCQKSVNNGSTDQARLEVRLTDNPPVNIAEAWVDIREVSINMGDSGWISLDGTRPGMYNLLDLTNGRDTLLSNALIPTGSISQIRLVLGDNNYVITDDGDSVHLETPSAQQSGLKVQVHQTVNGGMLYRLKLDFDAAQSIHAAGNSGRLMLKPVLRLISFEPSGGNVRGVVLPDSVITAIYALDGTDTVSSTFSDTTMGGAYYFNDIPAGSFTFSYVPQDTIHQSTTRSVNVTLGQTTVVDTVRLIP